MAKGNKKTDEIINLRDKVRCKVTKEGAELKSNDWKEGQEVTVHPVQAEKFERLGWVKIIGPVDRKEPYENNGGGATEV